MPLFRRKELTISPTLVETLAQALGQALSSVLQSQANQIKQTGDFLGVMQDLSAKKAAQVMGARGGKVTQERKRAAKTAKKQRTECVLCADPYHRGTTLEQIQFHRMHEGIGGIETPIETSGNPDEIGQ